MSRLARTVCAQVPHHVTQRGNRREDVFFSHDDRLAYLAWLQEYAGKHNVDILAYRLEKFIQRLKKLAGRALPYRPPGRPKKGRDE